MTCSACKYWEDIQDGSGLCHRNPPTLNIGRDAMCVDSWVLPLTMHDEWCGQFEAYEEDEAEEGSSVETL
jgi:hypothetical protein